MAEATLNAEAAKHVTSEGVDADQQFLNSTTQSPESYIKAINDAGLPKPMAVKKEEKVDIAKVRQTATTDFGKATTAEALKAKMLQPKA